MVNLLSINIIGRDLNGIDFVVGNGLDWSVHRLKFFSDFVWILNLNFLSYGFRNGLNESSIGDSVAWNVNRSRYNFGLVFSREVHRLVVHHSFLSLDKLRLGLNVLVQDSWLGDDSLFNRSLYSFGDVLRCGCDSLGQHLRRSSYSFCYNPWFLLNFLHLTFVVSREVFHLPSCSVSEVISV